MVSSFLDFAKQCKSLYSSLQSLLSYQQLLPRRIFKKITVSTRRGSRRWSLVPSSARTSRAFVVHCARLATSLNARSCVRRRPTSAKNPDVQRSTRNCVWLGACRRSRSRPILAPTNPRSPTRNTDRNASIDMFEWMSVINENFVVVGYLVHWLFPTALLLVPKKLSPISELERHNSTDDSQKLVSYWLDWWLPKPDSLRQNGDSCDKMLGLEATRVAGEHESVGCELRWRN